VKIIQIQYSEVNMTSKQINARRKQSKKRANRKAKIHESIQHAKKKTKLALQAAGKLPKSVVID
jgi:hypothetical protein